MIQSQSEEVEIVEKPQQVFIKVMLSEAKQLISPNRQFSDDFMIRQFIVDRPPMQTPNRNHRTTLKNLSSLRKLPDKFYSRFECGNLKSFEVAEDGKLFNLVVKNDTNSKRQSQWFYFRVQGIKHGTFVIHGFTKTSSLFNMGMKLCIKEDGTWRRAGDNITYKKIEDSYAVTFEYEFRRPQMITEVAYCYPFSYSELLSFIQQKCYKNRAIRKEIITRTLLDNEVYCLTFGQSVNKPVIVIVARVHPGETVSSFIAKGIIEQLAHPSKQTKLLLANYEIKLIPMINPDGVKEGNYRFSFAGVDLNRRWKNPNSRLHQEVHQTKLYLAKYSKRICMFIDLHGHSRKKGVFFYGCTNSKQDWAPREFPYLMSRISKDYSYENCSFRVHQSKQGTARIHFWNLLKIPYVYTLECSFCGRVGSNHNFEVEDFEKIGKDLITGITLFFSRFFPQQGQARSALLQERASISEQFRRDQKIIATDDQDDEGSDSDPSQGQLTEDEVMKLLEESGRISFDSKQKKQSDSTNTTKRKLENHRLRKIVTSSVKNTTKAQKLQQVDRIISTKLTRKAYQKKQSIIRNSQERQSKTKLLTDVRSKNELNIGGIDLPKKSLRTINFTSVRLTQSRPSFLNSQIASETPQTNSHHNEQRSIFYGPQYIRVKKYAEKMRQEQNRLHGRDLFVLPNKQNFSIIPLQSQREALKFDFDWEGGEGPRNRSLNRW